MSDTILLGGGTLIFLVTVWATLAFGYSVFGDLYDRDKASEMRRRQQVNDEARERGEPEPARPARDIAHDRPGDLT